MHSNVSDGTDTPTEVVRAAHAAGVRTMALTDHDTTAGWAEAAAECQRLGMTFIGGMEITARGARGGGVHMLAYLFDPEEETLLSAVNSVLAARIPRLQEMTDRLADDYTITWDDVLAESNGASIGRPHLASAMQRLGYVEDTDDFFERIVTKESKYFVPSPGLDVRDVIDLVRGAGGVAITAHPVGRHNHVMPREHMVALKAAGLGGFELGHRENAKNPAGLAALRAYAEEFDLIVTGSSDYHGTRKPNRPGENETTPEMLMRIIDDSHGYDPIYPTSAG